MAANAASDQASGDDGSRPQTGSTPPIADLTGRPAPAPGPLTKPAPVIRAPKRRRRWLVPLIAVAVLAAAGATAIIWQATQAGFS